MKDLGESIEVWKKLGDSIVVMGDWNEDVESDKFILWRDHLGLKDATLESLGEDEKAPNTYSRGTRPIGTILATRGVEGSKAGYLSFGEGVEDHRPLFVDIVTSSVLGVKLPPIFNFLHPFSANFIPSILSLSNNSYSIWASLDIGALTFSTSRDALVPIFLFARKSFTTY